MRNCQNRLKQLVCAKYIKCYRENVISQNVYFIRKPKNSPHKIKFSQLLVEIKQQNIELLKYKCPFSIGDVIDNVVKANINNRIVFKCEDSKNSIVALDKEGAENLKGNGNGIIKRGSKLEEFQAYFITDTEVKKLIKPYIKPKSENKPINEQTIKDDNKTSYNPNKQATDNIIDLSFIDNL